MDSGEGPARFDFDFHPLYALPLRLVGVTPERAWVELDGTTLRARFGRWRVTTGLDNVAGVQRTGPYHAYKAIGVRLSFADRGLTFGSTTNGGVCIRFHRPVRGMGLGLRHPGLTVTVADPDRLVAEVERRAGT